MDRFDELRLSIYESCDEGYISESARDEMLDIVTQEAGILDGPMAKAMNGKAKYAYGAAGTGVGAIHYKIKTRKLRKELEELEKDILKENNPIKIAAMEKKRDVLKKKIDLQFKKSLSIGTAAGGAIGMGVDLYNKYNKKNKKNKVTVDDDNIIDVE